MCEARKPQVLSSDDELYLQKNCLITKGSNCNTLFKVQDQKVSPWERKNRKKFENYSKISNSGNEISKKIEILRENLILRIASFRSSSLDSMEH